ncbi:DUF805 domain-containing protein [Lactovum odontotermitis]
MIKAYKDFWKLALKPNGRSSRSDYWWTFLINTIIRAIITLFSTVIIIGETMKLLPDITTTTNPNDIQQLTEKLMNNMPLSVIILQIVGTVFSLLIMVPVTTLTARRLRDAGYSPALAYPLPAIYLANAIAQFVSVPILSSITLFAGVYALILLIFCAKKAPDSEQEGRL